jgi:hypothetical protein
MSCHPPTGGIPHYCHLTAGATALALVLLAGCQTTAPVVSATAVEEGEAGAAVVPVDVPRYEILPAQSEVRVLVYRAGALAKFGHNHVVTGPVEGHLYRAGELAMSGFRLRIPVTDFDVDRPAARAEEGENFPGTLSDQARAGTRTNMLGETQLAAAEYPYIEVESIALSGPSWNPDVRARVQIRDIARTVRFPAAVFEAGDRLVVIANFAVNLTDFGIEPFEALGGGLQVRDTLVIRVRVTARRTQQAAGRVPGPHGNPSLARQS